MDKAGKNQKAAGARRSGAEGRKLVEDWRASGLTGPEYCRRTGVGLHVLRYWAKNRREKSATKIRPDFVVVTAGQDVLEPATRKSPEQRIGPVRSSANALMIVLPLGSKSETLADALRAVLHEVRS